ETLQRPSALPVIAAAFPERLVIGVPHVVWRYTWRPGAPERPGKWDKPPLDARNLRPASVTDASSWVPFEDAVRAYSNPANDLDGIGIVLRRESGETESLVAWDLDHCRDAATGALEPWATEIIVELDTYAELSPSGRGVRLFCHGRLPPAGRKKGRVECYD